MVFEIFLSINNDRAIFTSVLILPFQTPFCWGVLGAKKLWVILVSPQNSSNVAFSNFVTWSKLIPMILYPTLTCTYFAKDNYWEGVIFGFEEHVPSESGIVITNHQNIIPTILTTNSYWPVQIHVKKVKWYWSSYLFLLFKKESYLFTLDIGVTNIASTNFIFCRPQTSSLDTNLFRREGLICPNLLHHKSTLGLFGLTFNKWFISQKSKVIS